MVDVTMRYDDKLEISRLAALPFKHFFKLATLKWKVGVDQDMTAVGLYQVAVCSIDTNDFDLL
jgi:hypothetical protein